MSGREARVCAAADPGASRAIATRRAIAPLLMHSE
jgi:hypothetical protein